ncbi:hypothetical protein [Hydrogenophaga sp. T2]|uniref:hypothetical protein n=1 Tax=Hydrogenophaga sp. T2 TaxID=3132823 RepID=UPI003CEF5FC0
MSDEQRAGLKLAYTNEAAKVRQGSGIDGGPPDNGGMEARVVKLEEFAQDTRDRLTRIETRLDQTATKADLSEAMNGLVKWVVGTAVGLGVAGITVMTFVLNNATPRAATSPNPPPVIINVPPPAVAASPTAAPQPAPAK